MGSLDNQMTHLSSDIPAYFIKLGRGGVWEKSCLADGTLKFGYHETSHDDCLSGHWSAVHEFWTHERRHAGTAKNDVRQIQTFYEADETAIFITFSDGYLWWCQPTGRPQLLVHENNARLRQTVAGWRKTSLKGTPLLISRLSGKLTKMQMFRGTICEVSERAYLLRRLNDQPIEEVAAAEATEVILLDQILAMVRLLDPRDFELMVELIFSTSGWQRQTRTGGTQKTVDLDLLLPSTGERAFVQVKSETSADTFEAYAAAFASTDAHARMFYVWHTGSAGTQQVPPGITLWGPSEVSGKVLQAGLLAWLKDRVS